MNITLKPAGDQTAVNNLLATCELPYEDITPSKLGQFWTLRDGDALAGVVGLELYDNIGLLRSLAVLKRYRGRGLGSELLSKAEEQARSQGIEALFLLTTTADEFFAQRGYERVERNSAPNAIKETAAFRSLCPDSAVCMVKWL
jgi:amino-acid N-acetyltransferase